MIAVVVMGAGGKMGYRVSMNLRGSEFEARHVEVSATGRERLAAEGLNCMPVEQALTGADAVILAIPDNVIGKVSHGIDSIVRPGTMVIALDAAAPFAGGLPKRDDVTYFVAHPCHPPIFNDEVDPEAKRDYFGGIKRSSTSSAPNGKKSSSRPQSKRASA